MSTLSGEKGRLKNAPQQKRSADKLNAILKAANEEFGSVGYHDAKISVIAKKAKVSIGALYHLFPDKEAIANTLIDNYQKDANEAYKKVAQGLQGEVGLPEMQAVLSGLVRAAADLQLNHPGYYAISEKWNPGDQEKKTHDVRDAISQQFIGFMQIAGVEVNDGSTMLMLNFALEAMRHFLHLAPKKEGKEREAYIQELERMMTAYVFSRLQSAM